MCLYRRGLDVWCDTTTQTLAQAHDRAKTHHYMISLKKQKKNKNKKKAKKKNSNLRHLYFTCHLRIKMPLINWSKLLIIEVPYFLLTWIPNTVHFLKIL